MAHIAILITGLLAALALGSAYCGAAPAAHPGSVAPSRIAIGRALWVAMLALLALGGAAAQASEATLLAERAGFLVGNAHRCGVEEARVTRATALSNTLIGAFAIDDVDEATARTRFGDHVLASALATLLGDAVPPCSLVRSQLTTLEQHRGTTVGDIRPREGAAAARRASTIKPGKPKGTPPSRHAELAAPHHAIN